MNHYYSIDIQFATPDAPDIDKDVFNDFEKAIQAFNISSRVAKNKKAVIRYRLKDPKTLNLILSSSVELPMPSRALRLITVNMLEKEKYSSLVYGKALFKSSSKVIQNPEKTTEAIPDSISALKIEIIKRVISEGSESKLLELKELLETQI